MNRRLFLHGAIGTAAVLSGCGKREQTAAEPETDYNSAHKITTVLAASQVSNSPQITKNPIKFVDVSREAGISWKFSNGATGAHYMIESTGGGVAFLDYNNDGLLDIFAVQSGPVPGAVGASRNFPSANVLYRNNGDGTFTDVTAEAGLNKYTGYGQGVSVADYNNDGYPDIYVTAYGGNTLFRNNGNGTFTDVTIEAGLKDISGSLPWPLSSGWADLHNSGHLDLFVCHYVDWSPKTNQVCKFPNGDSSYCRPQSFAPTRCSLYRNNGDGTFTDISRSSGIASADGKSMGVVLFDYDDDGWMDIFVTNDTMVNCLFHNNRDGTFTDVALRSGVAYGTMGLATSGMGVCAASFSESGREDLIFVNYANEPKTVLTNMGEGLFRNDSDSSKISATNQQYLGFGLDCFDYDNDGLLDFVVGNGHVLDKPDPADPEDSYLQSQQLFHNNGDGTFSEDTHSLGDLVIPRVTRGLAVGDFDNDGGVDVLMVSQTGPLQLYKNIGGNAGNWIMIRLQGTRSNRDAVGAKIEFVVDGKKHYRRINGGGSYCSSSDKRLLLGLGTARNAATVKVTWPSGTVQTAHSVASGKHYVWKESAELALDPRAQPIRHT